MKLCFCFYLMVQCNAYCNHILLYQDSINAIHCGKEEKQLCIYVIS